MVAFDSRTASKPSRPAKTSSLCTVPGLGLRKAYVKPRHLQITRHRENIGYNGLSPSVSSTKRENPGVPALNHLGRKTCAS
jgi:hypothetical protein